MGISTFAILAGCSHERGGPQPESEKILDPTVLLGQSTFMAHCNQCHPGGYAGLGPAINDKPLPRWMIRTQVRTGLGAMPAFDQSKISVEDLDATVEYLKYLRARAKRDAAFLSAPNS